MGSAVSYVLQFSVRDGKSADGKALMNEMVKTAQAESGTTDYDWYISDDGASIHVYERFADSGAALTHLSGFGANFAERFMTCFEPTGLNVYGKPSTEVREILTGFGGKFLGPLGGFQR